MASFASAFREARKSLGAGKTFTWNGKQYSTNLAEEGRSSGRPKRETAPPPRPARTAPTSSPRPKSRPDSTTRLTRAAGAAIDRAERQSSGKRGSGERSRNPIAAAAAKVRAKFAGTGPNARSGASARPQAATPSRTASPATGRTASSMSQRERVAAERAARDARRSQ